VLHSARIDTNQVYVDPFKGARHSFSKKYEQFIEALGTSEYAIVRHGGTAIPPRRVDHGQALAVALSNGSYRRLTRMRCRSAACPLPAHGNGRALQFSYFRACFTAMFWWEKVQ
jgi:hypothetical protein